MARWTDLAEWRGPSPHITVDGMRRYNGLIVHIAVGWFEGTIAWQRDGSRTKNRTSSHFVTGRDPGELAQVVDTKDSAWTQGSGNGSWISVENEGFNVGHRLHQPGWERLSDWQIEANARLFARGHREFGWPLQLTSHPDRPGLGYHGMGAENGINWGHLHCPGEPIKAQLHLILARAIQIVGGDDMQQDEKLNADTGFKGRTVGDTLGDVQNLRNYLIGEHDSPVRSDLPVPTPGSPLGLMTAAAERILDGTAAVDLDTLAAKVAALMPKPPTAAEIARAVLDEDHRRTAA